MEDVMELPVFPISSNAASRRKRRRNFGINCIGQYEEPFAPFLPGDSENPLLKKKGGCPASEKQKKDVSGIEEVEDVHHSLHDHLVTNNKLNSLVGLSSSPGSDSNSTLPLEIEPTKNIVFEVIDLAAVDSENAGTISCNSLAIKSYEANEFSGSKGGLEPSDNVTDTEECPSVVSEPPGNFAFINLGFVPSSLCSGDAKLNDDASTLFPASEGVTIKKTPLPDVENRQSSCAVVEEKEYVLNYSPSPPMLLPFVDNKETNLILPSSSQPVTNDLVAVSGTCPSAISSGQDCAILPEGASVQCIPRLPQRPLHGSENNHFSHFSVTLSEREEYIPLNVGNDELENKELELRNAAFRTKELLATIISASKRLENERELLKSKLTELHADMIVRAEVINSLNESSTINKERLEQSLKEKNQQHDLTVEIKIRLVKKELAMRELQVAICHEKLLAVSSETPVDSLNLEIARNQEKVKVINVEIQHCYENAKMAKEKLLSLVEQLKNEMEEDRSLRRRIDELDLQQRKAESLLLKNQESLRCASLELKELVNQRKTHSTYFVNLERMMVKIKMCRKLKELDRKEERIIGKKIHVRSESLPEKLRSTSNLQYASQFAVFGTSYQPTTTEQAITSRGSSSFQHFTSLQSIAIKNHVPWFPRSFLSLPRFPPGLRQMVSIPLPWVDSHDP